MRSKQKSGQRGLTMMQGWEAEMCYLSGGRLDVRLNLNYMYCGCTV